MMTQVQSLVPHLGMDEKVTRSAAESLIQLFADEFALQFKTWNLSYNIVGPRFYQIKEMLCEQTNCLKKLSELTSVQIRNLGVRVPAVTEVLRISKIEPPKSDFVDEDYVINSLLKDHETILQNLMREQDKLLTQVKEYIVQDFILDVIKAHRKMAWTLRSHLEIIPASQQQWGQQYGQQQGWQQQQQWGQPSGQQGQWQQGYPQGQQGQYGQGMQSGQFGQQGQFPQEKSSSSFGQQGQQGQFGQQGQQWQPSQQGQFGQQPQGQQGQYGQQGMQSGQFGQQGQLPQEKSSFGQQGQQFPQGQSSFGQQGQQGQTGIGMGTTKGATSSSGVRPGERTQQGTQTSGVGASIGTSQQGVGVSAETQRPSSSATGTSGTQGSTAPIPTSGTTDVSKKEYPYTK